MIEALRFFCLIIIGLSLLSMLAGLWKPVLVLWFLDRMNRLMVLKIYGFVAALAWIVWIVLGLS